MGDRLKRRMNDGVSTKPSSVVSDVSGRSSGLPPTAMPHWPTMQSMMLPHSACVTPECWHWAPTASSHWARSPW